MEKNWKKISNHRKKKYKSSTFRTDDHFVLPRSTVTAARLRPDSQRSSTKETSLLPSQSTSSKYAKRYIKQKSYPSVLPRNISNPSALRLVQAACVAFHVLHEAAIGLTDLGQQQIPGISGGFLSVKVPPAAQNDVFRLGSDGVVMSIRV